MTLTSDQLTKPNPETLAYEQQSYEQQIQTQYIEQHQQINPAEVVIKSEPQICDNDNDNDNDNDSDENDEYI